MRIVEGQALCRDVPVPGAERGPGITVREAGRLEPMDLLIAVPEEEAVCVRQVVVDLDVELIVVTMFDRVEQVVVDDLSVGLSSAGRIRLGIELLQDVRARPSRYGHRE